MTKSERIFATIEARMTSSRLPGKVLMPAVGKPMLELMVERVKRVPSLNGIILATTTNKDDDLLEDIATRLDIHCHRGSEDDVLQRVLDAAQENNVDTIVELTGDCPLIDPGLIEECIQSWFEGGADYVGNSRPSYYPIGMDTEIFSTESLARVAEKTQDQYHHEHVSTYFTDNPESYRIRSVAGDKKLHAPTIHLTLDTQDDYDLIKIIFEELYPINPNFTLAEILEFLKNRSDLLNIIENVERNFF